MEKFYLVPAHLYEVKHESSVDKSLEIVEHLPQQHRNKAKMIINQLKICGVTLGENNNINLNNEKISGSNYIDLLRFLLYGVKLPNKWSEIHEFLLANNFPNSLIPQKLRFNVKKSHNWISL